MFQGKSEIKILAWREFRNSLSVWPDDIEQVAKIWTKAPITNNYLAYDTTENWPDPWALISTGIFCDISIALGIFYTLYYSSYPYKEQMKILHYKLASEHQTLNLVSLEEGKYMLNYQLGQSVNIQQVKQLSNPNFIVTAQDLPIKK
jgi:hypothetical protein